MKSIIGGFSIEGIEGGGGAGVIIDCFPSSIHFDICTYPAQDRGPFWFSYILNEILQYIEIWNKF